MGNFKAYEMGLRGLHERGLVRIPVVPIECSGNAHIFFILLPSLETRLAFERELKRRGVSAFSHYVPLHSAPAGLRFGRVAGSMAETDRVFAGLLRLPVWLGLREDEIQKVILAVGNSSEL